MFTGKIGRNFLDEIEWLNNDRQLKKLTADAFDIYENRLVKLTSGDRHYAFPELYTKIFY